MDSPSGDLNPVALQSSEDPDGEIDTLSRAVVRIQVEEGSESPLNSGMAIFNLLIKPFILWNTT